VTIERLGLSDALRAWSAAIGGEHVSADDGTLLAASTATFATSQHVRAILRPGSLAEVQECVRIANRCRVPLYPISSGRNWGYGSRVPPQDGVLLDLARLNRILEYSEELAYVTIEPGVTQRQLHEYLRQRGSRLWMDATGASPECSIVGNTLERGFGHTPMGDHCGAACGLQVVLPTGECIETGFSRFEGSTVGPLSRSGVGPSLDGLFAQSNFGIVTRMSVWLMPAPEAFSAFFFMCHGEDDLARVADALRPLRLNGTLRSVVHIGNDYKVLAAGGGTPAWHRAGQGPIGADAMAAWRRSVGIGSWNGSGGLYGTKAQVREARRQVRRALAGKVDRLHFIDDRRLRLMERFAAPFKLVTGWDLGATLDVLKPLYGLLKGIPTDSALKSAYWRKHTVPRQTNPDRDGCGLLWCSPVVPAVGSRLAEVTRLASDTLLDFGFEPQMSISLTTERSATCVISIGYDRATPGADQRAHECYARLSRALLERGYPPYRLAVTAMSALEEAPAYADLLRALKQAVDPAYVLAPGRYEPAVDDRSARSLDVA
jgi:4-cresol dehydrogenase (hydroxylating)